MFEVGFSELVLLAIVGLLVLGPERLPGAVRSCMRWVNQVRRMLASAQHELERELNTDELKRELHNAQIMQALEEGRDAATELARLPYDISGSIGPKAPAQDAPGEAPATPAEKRHD